MRSFSPERESITAASSTHEESLADALASAVPSSGPDHRFLRDDCGGVPAWEVQMLVDPAPSPKPLTPTEEDSLLQMAARARADGQHWRAHTLAEQAYAGRRSLSTLLYLIGIRVDELGEATFGAAAYHTMLRVLPLRDDERAKVITLFKKAHKTMFTQRRHEDAAVLIQYRATQLRRGKKHGLPTGTSALAPSGAPSMAPAATQGRLPFEEKLSSDTPSWTRTSQWEARDHKSLESGDRGRRAAFASAYDPYDDDAPLSGRPPPVRVPSTPYSAAPTARTPYRSIYDQEELVTGSPATARPPWSASRVSNAGRTPKPVPRLPLGGSDDDSDDYSYKGGMKSGKRVVMEVKSPRPSSARASSRSPKRDDRTPTSVRLADAVHGSRDAFQASRGRMLHTERISGSTTPRGGSPYATTSSRAMVPVGAVLSHSPKKGGGRYGTQQRDKPRPMIPQRVANAFERYDRNRSGYLDYFELGRALREAGVNVDDDAGVARRIVRAYDDLPNGRLDLYEFAQLVADMEGGVIRAAAVTGGTGGELKPIRQPLISPLIPPKRPDGGRGRTSSDHVPMLSTYYRGQLHDTQSYEPRSGLEEWLDGLPGLEPKRPPPLLGVRPLERGEAIARVLRMECTLWQAQKAYIDSHKLYLRQWIALQLQALYRGWKVREEFERRKGFEAWERRIRGAIGWWRNRTATKCFYGWKAVAQKTHRAWGMAEKMVVRMLQKDVTYAFNTWSGHMKAKRKARATLKSAIKMWQGGTMRSFKIWKAAAAARLEKRRKQTWGIMALKKPELRFAMSRWQENTEEQRAVRRAAANWRNRPLAAHFRQWKGKSGGRSLRSGGARGRNVRLQEPDYRHQQQMYYQSMRELMSRPCVKKARYTGRWKVVRLQLSGSGLTYAASGGGPGATAGQISKVRTLQLAWIAGVEPAGVARISSFGLPAQRACWKWSLLLTPLGQQHCGKKVLTFGCQTADAMSCWVEELRRAVDAHASSAAVTPRGSMMMPSPSAALGAMPPRSPASGPPMRSPMMQQPMPLTGAPDVRLPPPQQTPQQQVMRFDSSGAPMPSRASTAPTTGPPPYQYQQQQRQYGGGLSRTSLGGMGGQPPYTPTRRGLQSVPENGMVHQRM